MLCSGGKGCAIGCATPGSKPWRLFWRRWIGWISAIFYVKVSSLWKIRYSTLEKEKSLSSKVLWQKDMLVPWRVVHFKTRQIEHRHNLRLGRIEVWAKLENLDWIYTHTPLIYRWIIYTPTRLCFMANFFYLSAYQRRALPDVKMWCKRPSHWWPPGELRLDERWIQDGFVWNRISSSPHLACHVFTKKHHLNTSEQTIIPISMSNFQKVASFQVYQTSVLQPQALLQRHVPMVPLVQKQQNCR